VAFRDYLREHPEVGTTFEANIPFTIRNRIDNPEVYTPYPQTEPLKFLFFDVEQYTKKGKMFPDYTDRIISIAYCSNDRKVWAGNLGLETETDEKLLEKFRDIWNKIDPDIVVVFNKHYDIPTLFNRCKRNGIDPASFTRNGKDPYFGGENIVIPGRIIYDVYDSAEKDQTLSGNVVNRGLKEVSDYYGFKTPYKTLNPKEISDYVGKEELINYNKDDVRRLLLLFDTYWPNIEFNADDLKIPLGEAVDLSVTDLALNVVGDEYRKQGIIADGDNHHRYPQIFQRAKKPDESNYQGALVDIYKKGTFFPVYKVDFSSMYPSIMATFNLSPDTTQLLMFKEYTGKFSITEDEYWYLYEIPDNVLNKNMVIQVSKKAGFMASVVSRLLKERSGYKKLYKDTGEKRYDSMSSNRKVKANGIYGIMGSEKHAFGFVPIAIAVTGIGRECVQLLIDILQKLYPNSVIEVDTDGIYFTTQSFNKQEILDEFYVRLKEKFKKDLALSVDFDTYKAGWFYLAKNYCLLSTKDKFIFHGASLKASSKDLLSKSMIREMTEAKFARKPTDTIERKYRSLDFPLEYFALNVKLGMPIKKYKNKNSLAPRLALAAKKELGIPPTQGQQYYYIKSDKDYMLYELASKDDIDRRYYLNEIDQIVEMFRDKPIVQKLDKWLC
jgi:DNA polymerase elongation subunit (family B)